MALVWKQKPIAVFFALGFGVPWVGWTLILLTGITGPLRTVLFYTGDFMSVAGIVATYAAGGSSAVRALFRRMFARADLGWWLLALLLPLGWTLAARTAYGLAHGTLGAFHPGALSVFVSAGAWRAWTTGPWGEEFGWRGFFLPRLLTAYRPVIASLILGVIWAAWHYPLYARSVFAKTDSAISFTVSVICFAILMTVFWFRTRGSILIAILFHWSVNVSPNVAASLLPAGLPDDGAGRWWELGALILVTLYFMYSHGPESLGQREEFVVRRDLADERIE